MSLPVLDVVSKYLSGPFKPSGGSNVITKCPFHKDGMENRPSFSINLEKGVFHCFTGGCPAGSGSIKKLLEMLSVPGSTITSELETLRPFIEKVQLKSKFEKEYSFSNTDQFKVQYPLTEVLIGTYNFLPLSLKEDGFDVELLKRMEIGYDVANNRVMYPIRDLYGNLAGFSGGMTNLTTTHMHQKYRVYNGRYRNHQGQYVDGDYGEWFEYWFKTEYQDATSHKCINHDHLWNFHRVWAKIAANPESVPVLYVVEGFKACLWMIQSGFEDTVALMGSYVSDKQRKLINRFGGRVVLCLDNDAAGIAATLSVGQALWRPNYGNIYVMQYPEEDSGLNTQPDDYETESLKHMVNRNVVFTDHLNHLKKAYGNDIHLKLPSLHRHRNQKQGWQGQ